MVFFTCNVCNESLKKSQVAKHRLHKCRNSQYFSCVDCGHDFWGNDFENHTKCMSEEQKYNGKHFVAKVNKGEVKQEQWIQKVQAAVQKAQPNPQLKTLLIKLEEFPNVPRKKAKFENFLQCSLRVFNQGLINEAWGLLMAEVQQQQNGSSNGTASNKEPEQEPSAQVDQQMEGSADVEKKLSKRERKEERKKKAHKAEKKDKSEPAEEDVKSHTRGKRRKRDEEDEEEYEAEEEENIQPQKKKKVEEESKPKNGKQNNSELVVEKKGKFDWAATILAVLQSKGEISVKRLKKKVLAEYETYGGSRGEEKAEAKFNKTLRKLPNVKVLKDKAKMTSF